MDKKDEDSLKRELRNTMTFNNFKVLKILRNNPTQNNSFLFNNTIGYSQTIPIMNIRHYSKDSINAKENNSIYFILPNEKDKDAKERMSYDKMIKHTKINQKSLQYEPNYEYNKNKKQRNASNKFKMQSTDGFNNIIKYKIKKSKIQPNSIININHNINHNIQINVTNNPQLTLSNNNSNLYQSLPVNLKNIKITNNDPLLTDNKQDFNDIINQINLTRNQQHLSTIISNESAFFSKKNSLISRQSLDNMKSFKYGSLHSSINDQDLSLNLSKDEKTTFLVNYKDNNIQGTNNKKSINQEDFKRFCSDLNSKLMKI